MKIIGITGRSGCGKSSVTKFLAAQGYPCIDADRIARDVLQRGSPCLAVLQAHFGADILDEQGELRRRLLAILARMEGGVAHGLYGYLDWLARQIMPDTAETEHLERWASIWGITRRTATQAAGYAAFSGEDGAAIPAGTEVQSPSGQIYVTLADAWIEDGTARAAIEAVEAGPDGNASDATPLQLTIPVAGVQARAAASGNITGGAAAETDASLRTRLLSRIRTLPSGGAARDYVTWTLEVAGVTRAWCYPGEMGRGSVTVRFMMDDAYENGIPQPEDVQRVADHLDGLRPVTADVYVVAPVPEPVNLDLRISPDNPRLRVVVAEAVWAVLRRDAVPGGTVVISRLNEAISGAEGEEDHVLLSPTQNIQIPTGKIAVPGSITWEEA